MSQDEWNEIYKDLSKEIKPKITQLPPKLNDAQITEVLNDFVKYYAIEKTKKENERKVFNDKYGGHIAIIRFPKKSILEKIKNKKNWTPSQSKNDALRWYGAIMPLFNDFPVTLFISESFFPIVKNKKGEPVQTSFEDFWEPEDKIRLVVVRGLDTEEYKWIEEDKDSTIYARKETEFIKEAKVRFEGKEINSIKDVDIGYLGAIKHTFNVDQLLKIKVM